MASLVAPPRRLPTTLLNLDCSADLTTYSRSLGPAAETRPLPISSDALRAQFETHRENVLRHRQTLSYVGGASPAQTPMMGHREVSSHHQQQQQPPAYRQQPSAPQSRTHTPVSRNEAYQPGPPPHHRQAPPAPPSRTQTPASHNVDFYPPGPPPQAYRRPSLAPPSRTQTPTSRNAESYSSGPPPPQAHHRYPSPAPPPSKQTPAAAHADEYPPPLGRALITSARSNGARWAEQGSVFNIFEDVRVKNSGRSHTSKVIGEHKNLHYANLAAADHLLATGYWKEGDDLEVVLEEGGTLRIGVDLQRTGDRLSLYVARAWRRGGAERD